MVTGDNMLTAVSVARNSGFIRVDQKVILVTTAEVDGFTQIRYHSDTPQSNGATSNKLSEVRSKKRKPTN